MIKKGILYGVGVGPGNPELMTYKAVNTIENADIIAIPGLDKEKTLSYKIVSGIVKNIDAKECMNLEMPMVRDEDLLRSAHEKAAEQIIKKLTDGKSIAYLTLGDPTVYSTYVYVKNIVEESGFETKIVNGIPSFCAASALINEALTIKNDELHIIPAIGDLEELLKLKGTKVVMKMPKDISAIKTFLNENNLNATMVSNCGMESEAVYNGVKSFPDSVGYYSLLIVK